MWQAAKQQLSSEADAIRLPRRLPRRLPSFHHHHPTQRAAPFPACRPIPRNSAHIIFRLRFGRCRTTREAQAAGEEQEARENSGKEMHENGMELLLEKGALHYGMDARRLGAVSAPGGSGLENMTRSPGWTAST